MAERLLRLIVSNGEMPKIKTPEELAALEVTVGEVREQIWHIQTQAALEQVDIACPPTPDWIDWQLALGGGEDAFERIQAHSNSISPNTIRSR